MYNFIEEKEKDRKLLMVKATNVSTFKVKKIVSNFNGGNRLKKIVSNLNGGN